jgi:hypothetical protein
VIAIEDQQRFLVLSRHGRLEQVERLKRPALLIERHERRRLVARARVAGDHARQMGNVAAQFCCLGAMLAVDYRQRSIGTARHGERLAQSPNPKTSRCAE